MNTLCRLLAALLLLCTACVHAQVPAEPGAGSTQLAAAAPQASTDPNLRVDAEPPVTQNTSAESAPAPETLGVDATPVMDLGPDWSLPQDTDQPSILKRIETHKGKVTVVDVQTQPVMPRPVTNPPEPPVTEKLDIPLPSVQIKPPPPNPLDGIPQ